MSTKLSIEPHRIVVQHLTVDVVRKSIKNLHLGVYPPEGRVRVAAPMAVSDEAVRRAVIGKLGWIKRQQANFRAQQRQGKREMIDGESHYFLGQRYRLRIVESTAAPKVVLNKSRLELYHRFEATPEERERVLHRWYRARLKELVAPLLEKWQPVVGTQPLHWGVRKMKTRWGSCNTETSRILLNLELAKKPIHCVEYILVHELAHLRERQHSDAFRAILDRSIPNWEQYQIELNSLPVKHEEWE